MKISALCIQRPVFASVLSIIIVVLGLASFSKMEIRGTPDIDIPVVTITSTYPGADAEYMNSRVSYFIEQAIKNVANIDYITTNSSQNLSQVIVFFKLGSNIESGINDLRAKVSQFRYLLPKNLDEPIISKVDGDAFPTLWIAVSSSKRDIMELSYIVDKKIKNTLERLPTVGDILFVGERKYTMYIEPNLMKMQHYNIGVSDIEMQVLSQNREYPAGILKSAQKNYNITMKTGLEEPKDFDEIILGNKNNDLLRLKDVAFTYMGPSEELSITRFNGSQSLALGLIRKQGANLIEMSKQVRNFIPQIQEKLPEDVELKIAYDGSTPVNEGIRSVFRTMFEALILVTFVTYFFLGNIKSTIIPSIVIPISLIGSLTFMYLLDFSINTFSLLGIILAIGLVVDDAIVCMENIFHYVERGFTKKEAAILGSKEISFAIVAMTITLAAVFLPIGFLGGVIGKLFMEFSWTLTIAVLISGFVALTITPMMCSKMLQDYSDKKKSVRIIRLWNVIFNKIEKAYKESLIWIIQHKKIFIAINILSIGITILCFRGLKKEFIPPEDMGALMVEYTGPKGSNLEDTLDAVLNSEKVIASSDIVQDYFTVAGFRGAADKGFAYVSLKNWDERKKSQKDVQKYLNDKFKNIPSMDIVAIPPRSILSGTSKSPVEFYIFSAKDYLEIDQIAQKIVEKMQQSGLFINVTKSLELSSPQIEFIPDRSKMYTYKVSLDNVGNSLLYLVNGKKISDFKKYGEVFDVYLKASTQDLKYKNDISKIYIKNSLGESVALSNLGDVVTNVSNVSYLKYNLQNAILVGTYLNYGVSLDEALQFIQNLTKEIDKVDYGREYAGDLKRMLDASSGSKFGFIFALIFIFLVLAAQFESFIDPLIILTVVPLSIAGGILLLYICGGSLNLYSNIGIITLIGLVTKNSIMIVEFTKNIMAKGVELKDAVVIASRKRLRPIVMTSIAATLGAVPLIFAHGAESESRRSIGYVIVGGMVLGTFFSVYVVPFVYGNFRR